MEIKIVSISKVSVWDDNPRNIRKDDFERLKKQITELGIYKPLIAFPENGGYTVLGGNMRLLALNSLGIKEVEISIVHPKTKAEKIKYSLSDNDRVGEYQEDALIELIYPHIEEIDLEAFKVDLLKPVSLKSLIDGVGPSEEKEVDKSDEKENKCPKCGYKWSE